jgi:predicted ribosomally synthesized peptide with nif11-like leader
MSHQAVLACVERMQTDQAFRDQVSGSGDDAARLEVINAAGFAVTTQDREALDAALTSAEDELSDAQLESISGGTGVPSNFGGNGSNGAGLPGTTTDGGSAPFLGFGGAGSAAAR